MTGRGKACVETFFKQTKTPRINDTVNGIRGLVFVCFFCYMAIRMETRVAQIEELTAITRKKI